MKKLIIINVNVYILAQRHDGEIPMTIKEIAEKTGLSTATVSRALDPRYKSKLRESTRKKVLAVAEKYSYRPVMIGKSFVTGKTYKIGLILDTMTTDLSSPTFSRFMEAACAELQSRNYTLLLLLAKDVKKYAGANVRELLESKVADGYILGKSMVFESVREILDKTPVVLITSREDGIPESSASVQIRRSFLSAYRTMWQLIPSELRRSVAVVASRERTLPGKTRAELIADMAPRNAEVKTFTSDVPAGFLVDRINAAALAEQYFDELRQFKVIWGTSDLYALGVGDVFQRRGLIPGKDFFLLGMDNLELAMPGVEPFLTTCDQHWDEVGRLAADTVLRLIDGKTVAERELTVESELIQRASSQNMKYIKPNKLVKLRKEAMSVRIGSDC